MSGKHSIGQKFNGDFANLMWSSCILRTLKQKRFRWEGIWFEFHTHIVLVEHYWLAHEKIIEGVFEQQQYS